MVLPLIKGIGDPKWVRIWIVMVSKYFLLNFKYSERIGSHLLCFWSLSPWLGMTLSNFRAFDPTIWGSIMSHYTCICLKFSLRSGLLKAKCVTLNHLLMFSWTGPVRHQTPAYSWEKGENVYINEGGIILPHWFDTQCVSSLFWRPTACCQPLVRNWLLWEIFSRPRSDTGEVLRWFPRSRPEGGDRTPLWISLYKDRRLTRHQSECSKMVFSQGTNTRASLIFLSS